ncbi:hypothetical protein KVT40_001999 [Elsinoe batatas]|uniref:N-acetyltransferase ECO1 n=1 Tax=Elsinoe batatas TaxID=2601811 RepID=A0A8K0L7S4_9PEZI|nr:hypothetical protein KVT40_001999 [Elsinoe batatas]
MADLPKKSSVLKTYSRAHKRQRLDEGQAGIAKRRRVEDELPVAKPKPRPFSTVDAWLRSSRPATPISQLSSSGDDVFSDRPLDATTATPPSSPPPFLPELTHEQEQDESRGLKTSPTLTPLSINVQRAPTLSCKSKGLETPLVQMQINLGSNLQKTCKDCGMTFVRSDPGDIALHNKYHTRNMNGVDLGKAFRKWSDTNAVWKGSEGRLMVVVDGASKSFEKRKAREVLDVVQTELGAVDIPDYDLWAVEEPGENEKDGDARYRAFLYMVGPSCVGLCLAKRISEAREVISPSAEDGIGAGAQEEALTVADESRTVDTGISRIWTSKSHRKKGIGTALLDCVSRSFHPDRSVQKEEIAFSQPTTSGTALARKWFGKQYRWLVYVE